MIVRSTSRTIVFLFILFFPFISLIGATIKGTITDSKTKEPVIGAVIKIGESGIGAKSRLDGSYVLRNAPEGKQILKIMANGYKEFDTTVIVPASDEEITVDIGISYQVVKGGEIVVNGQTEHGSEAESQNTERYSDNVISAVSARTIEVSPDLAVADVSQRVSGVSMTRTAATGDVQYAIIRGMDKRYNYTTVDGIKIPSPDNKNRYIPLDIFPSELVDRLEVTKTLLPSMEGDAMGGVMNMVMKQAPDHEVASLQIGTGYDGLYTSGQKFFGFTADATESPRLKNGAAYQATIADFPSSTWNPNKVSFLPMEYLSASYGTRFVDDKLGVIAAASLQNSYRGSHSLFFVTDVNGADNTPHLANFDYRNYSTLQTRTGGMANLDYRMNEDNTFQLFGMYASLTRNELRDQFDTLNGKGSWPVSDEVTHSIRTTHENQGIGNVTLSGFDRVLGKDLELDWHAAYSSAVLNQPDQSTLSLNETVKFDTTGRYISTSQQLVNESSRRWTSSSDQDKSIYLNLKTTEDIFGGPVEFLYGGMYRTKTRTANFDEYLLDPNNANIVQTYNGTSISQDAFLVKNTTQGGDPTNPLNYTASENTSAWFVQTKFNAGNLTVVGGIRGERTDFAWTNSIPTPLARSLQWPQSGSVVWADSKDTSTLPFFFLPSLSLKFSPVENQNWRLSYFRSVSYPNFYEAVFNGSNGNGGVSGEDYTEFSNDTLHPSTAHNLDARWEYFPGGLDQILVGAFYKKIHNPIEYAIQAVQVGLQYGPANFGDATNYGFELDLRKYIGNFGISGNYTYTNSQITTPKVVKSNFASDTTSQTRPLQGQSAHIGNISLLYKDFESGTNAQISAVYTGPAIDLVSTFLNNDIWSTGFFQLDFSAEQKIWGNLAVYLKITNILNAAREEVIHQPYSDLVLNGVAFHVNSQTVGQNILVRNELYDRTYILGFRFRM